MIIGFTGKMGSGKSTALQTLREAEGLNGRPIFNVKFAQPLYDIQQYIYDRITRVIERPTDSAKDRKDRKLLQWLGTEWGRDTIGTNLWVDLWRIRVEEILIEHPRAIIVCDDVRFENEANMIKHLRGLVVRIHGHEIPNTGIAGHSSENGLPDSHIDYYLGNYGNLGEFKHVMINFHREFLGEQTNKEGS